MKNPQDLYIFDTMECMLNLCTVAATQLHVSIRLWARKIKRGSTPQHQKLQHKEYEDLRHWSQKQRSLTPGAKFSAVFWELWFFILGFFAFAGVGLVCFYFSKISEHNGTKHCLAYPVPGRGFTLDFALKLSEWILSRPGSILHSLFSLHLFFLSSFFVCFFAYFVFSSWLSCLFVCFLLPSFLYCICNKNTEKIN